MRDTQINTTGLVTRTRGDVDRNIPSLTGSSQTLLEASPSLRKRIIFKNGAADAAINITGGTAAIGGAGSITLQPYEGIALTGDDCPKTAVTVIGTAGQYFGCVEGF
jgi:hypothetical protein